METTEIFAILCAFISGSIFSVIELFTIRYNKISDFIITSRALYIYAFFYGALAVGVYMFAKTPMLQYIPFDGIGFKQIFGAILIGLSIKAITDLKVFSLNVGNNKTYPVGLKSFTQSFDNYMLSKVEFHWFRSYSAFISLVEAQYQNNSANDIHNIVVDSLQHFPDNKRVVTFLSGQFNQADNKRDKFSLVMREFGKQVFCEIFNCR